MSTKHQPELSTEILNLLMEQSEKVEGGDSGREPATHNEHVNAFLAKRYNRILELNVTYDDLSDRETTYYEIIGLASQLDLSLIIIQKYITILEQNFKIKSIRNLQGKSSGEYEIFENLWKRASIVGDASLEIKSGIIRAIIDSYEYPEDDNGDEEGRGGFVCIRGRVTRLLGAFTLLDPDKEIAAPEKTFKDIANEVYNFSAEIFKKQSEEFPDDYLAYQKDHRNEDERKRAKIFSDAVKSKFEKKIRDDYAEIVKESELNELIFNVHAAIE